MPLSSAWCILFPSTFVTRNGVHMERSITVKRAWLTAVFAVLAAALWMGAQAVPAHAAELAAGSLSAQAPVQVGTQSGFEYLDADKNISVRDRTAGSVSLNASTNTITLNGLSAKSLSINPEGKSFTLVLNGISSLDGFYSYSSITVNGSGSLAVSDTLNVFDKNVLTVNKGTIQGQVYASTLVMKGGAIKGSGDSAKISTRYGITMSGGTIALANPKYTGINVTNGDFTMSGGDLSVTGAGSSAICVSKFEGNSTANTGKATITGGSLTVSVTTPTSSWAIDAGITSNTLDCFKSIQGRLSNGAQFVVGGNQYQVMPHSFNVRLVKYGAKAKKAKVEKVTYGGYAYEVGAIGANAFNNSAGRKVTSITVNSYLYEIGANAFANTKALKTLAFKSTGWIKRVYDKKYNLKSLKVNADCSIAKKAFSKAGKGGGKNLTVKLGKSGVYRKEVAKYKKFLKKKGLSGKAKLKQW